MTMMFDVSVMDQLARGVAASKDPDKEDATISVLVVEDERTCRKLVEKMLQSSHFKVTSVESANRAVDLLDQGGNFDLMLIDVNLPGLNGFDLLRHVRALAGMQQIPVIMMSAESDPELPLKCLDGGADDFLQKPISRVLQRKIVLHVSRRRKEVSELEDLRRRLSEMNVELAGQRQTSGVLASEMEALQGRYVRLLREFHLQQGELGAAQSDRRQLVEQLTATGRLPVFYVTAREPKKLATLMRSGLSLVDSDSGAGAGAGVGPLPQPLAAIDQAFGPFPHGLGVDDLLPLTTRVCGFPATFNCALFDAIDAARAGTVTREQFVQFWEQRLAHRDPVTAFFLAAAGPAVDGAGDAEAAGEPAAAATAGSPAGGSTTSSSGGAGGGAGAGGGGSATLTLEQLRPWVAEAVSQPALVQEMLARRELALADAYLDALLLVVAFRSSRSGADRLTLREAQHSLAFQCLVASSNLQAVLPYARFRAARAQFEAMDKDGDGLVDRDDFAAAAHCQLLSPLLLDRVFAECGRKFASTRPGSMNFQDFFWFVLCEEERSAPAAQLFWFRCVEDGAKGFVSRQDLKLFYDAKAEETARRGGLVRKRFEDFLAELVDLVPSTSGAGDAGAPHITLRDLRNSHAIDRFCLALFSLEAADVAPDSAEPPERPPPPRLDGAPPAPDFAARITPLN